MNELQDEIDSGPTKMQELEAQSSDLEMDMMQLDLLCGAAMGKK